MAYIQSTIYIVEEDYYSRIMTKLLRWHIHSLPSILWRKITKTIIYRFHIGEVLCSTLKYLGAKVNHRYKNILEKPWYKLAITIHVIIKELLKLAN